MKISRYGITFPDAWHPSFIKKCLGKVCSMGEQIAKLKKKLKNQPDVIVLWVGDT